MWNPGNLSSHDGARFQAPDESREAGESGQAGHSHDGGDLV